MIIMEIDFSRNPSRVAKDLVGKTLVVYKSPTDIEVLGILTDVDAYENPMVERDQHVFTQKPGIISVFASRRGPIPVITAHSNSGTGLITLRKMVNGAADFGPRGIYDLSGLEMRQGKLIGTESGIYIGETGIDYSKQELVIANSMPSNGPENRVAYWKLKRK